MKVYDAVANAFVKEGATTVFGLLGDGQLTWWSAMAKHKGVRMIDAREEGAGLAMAEGYARASGKVGACSVTSWSIRGHVSCCRCCPTRKSS